MDIVPLVSAIAGCVEPGSTTRQQLEQRLAQLLSVTQHLKRTNVEANSLLTHVTLVAARVLPQQGEELSDRERELVLESLLQALTQDTRKQQYLRDVHAVVIDHLCRILVPLFVIDSSKQGLPEATRVLAIQCWRQLVERVATVHVPEKHIAGRMGGDRVLPCTLALRDYVAEYLPRDYVSLAVCALLDNAETAGDQQLRLRALETLGELFGGRALLGDRDSVANMFPGTASALTRCALAQRPSSLTSDGVWKKPIVAVRARALLALAAAISVMYSGGSLAYGAAGMAAVAESWAQQARAELKSIIDSDECRADEEGAGEEKSGEQDRLQQILWRLAGLRNTEGVQPALFSLFAQVSSEECAARMPGDCTKVAVETCLAIAGMRADLAGDYLLDLESRCSRDIGPIGGCVAAVLESLLTQFERYVVDGEPQQRTDVMCVVAGCMRVLGQKRALPLVSPWWRSRGLNALLASLSVSLPGTSLLITDTEESATSLTANQRTDSVAYVLDNYRGRDPEYALDLFVRAMAELVTVRELSAQLLSLLFDASEGHVAVLWLLRRVFELARSEDLGSMCPSVFQYCVDYCGSSQTEPLADDSQHDVHELMVLDVVSTLVPVIGPSVAYYMDTLLFPLLQTTMARSPVLQAQARRTLDMLAQQTSGSVSQMLRDNVDYIVEGCSQQIRSVALHPHVFGILSGAVRLVGRDILVFMDDVVEDTLDVCEQLAYDSAYAANGDSGEEIVTGALQFLEIVTRTIATDVADASAKAIEDNAFDRKLTMPDSDPIGSVLDEIDDAAAARMMEDLVLTDDTTETQVAQAQDESNDQEEAGPVGSPLAIKIVLSVQSFLYADSGAHQLLALKTVHNAVSALRSTRDVLPLINEVWPTLVSRLKSSRQDAFYVTLAACDVIEHVCTQGESWMRKRVRDDLWPHFEDILQRHHQQQPSKGGNNSSRSESELV
ncbi:hypothetical protein GGF43_003066, partial [Coemansia sp. RSA 2618]